MVRRAHVVMALLVGGFVAWAVTSRGWVVVTTIKSGDAVSLSGGLLPMTVDGVSTASLVPAAAVVALAAAGALAISGRLGRLVALLVAAAAGVAVLVATLRVLASPEAVALEQLGESTGVTGSLTGADLQVATTAWPWGAVAAGVVVLTAALVGLLRARSWGAVTRHDPPSAATTRAERLPVDDWDALSRDHDPTEDPTRHRPGGGDQSLH